MALYDGNALFGQSVVCKVIDHPTADQMAAYFGVLGQSNLFGGTRGSIIEVRGVLIGNSPSALNAQIQTLKSYRDGIGRVFTDSYGNAYANTVFRRYVPAGERVYRSAGGGYAEAYQATFEYLGG